MSDKVERLDKLFGETGSAHHKEWPGIHLDWAMWYADYLFDKLPAHLGQEVFLSEIIYALMLLSKEQPVKAPDVPWTRYYAEWFLEEYGEGSS
jgi:hypothetical protein